MAQAAGEAATNGGSTTAESIAFWVFAVTGVGGAIAMVTMRNVVHGALMLVLNFFAIAGLFLLLGSSFLAIIQIIIYAGAIMVLFLFVIMLLGVSRDDLLLTRNRWIRIGAWAVGAALVVAVALVFVGPFTGEGSVCGAAAAPAAVGSPTVPCAGLEDQLAASDEGSVGFAARRLFTRYTFVFEFVSLLLILAVVGAMLIGRRREPPSRPGGQVAPGEDDLGAAPGPTALPHGEGA